MKHVRLLVLSILWINIFAGMVWAGLNAGVEAPDFTLPTTEDQEITLSDFRGQIVILHFWKSN
jgi:hypothetical protein